ncbi:phage tail protein [Sphingobacterium sp. 2149]|uniref:phage tail protein n=1 Tax=Sphingobacterium sp. 2149 TaxID=2817763 RepID=UPI0028551B35|nr:phage tail protein [Sphingobacterium sp. 2149]MDR6734161.1 hypothetical protein [Sphingobacterium sp. 2149]
MKIQVYRGQDEGAEIPLNSSTFTNKIMAEHSLAFSFKSSLDLDIKVNDTLNYKGEVLTLNETVNFKKVSRFLFEYDFVFEGPRHSLSQFFIEHLGARKFSFSGTAEEWLHLIVDCANSKSSGWSVGEFEDLGRVTVEFDSTYILDCLTMVAQAMKAEWGIKGKVISLKKTIGTARDLSFSYGKGNGLYSLSRKSINEKKIVTRAYARGGDKNLPTGMKDYFKIPGYVEKNVNLYRVREGEFVDENIYPKRTGTVTGATTINKQLFSIIDSSIDFDLNNQKIDGESAYIVFKSGYLEGNQFEISSYNHTDKKIVFKANDEGNGAFFPTESVHAEVGDKYTLIGIRMPQSYIDAAVAELTAKRQEYLESNSSPRVVYELDLDILDLKRKNITLDIGDTVRLIDTQKGIDEQVRVTELSHPGHFPDVLENGMTYNAVIGNDVTYTLFEKIQNDIKENKQIITQTTRRSIEEDRILAARMRQLQNLVFDPDGYFDSTHIKPESIETLMLSVGAKSQNFLLNGVTINVNNGDDPKNVLITAGQLVHLEVKIEGLGYIWTIPQLLKTDLIADKHYYVAARCSRTALNGTWVISEQPISTESEVGFYHFNLGVIYSEFQGKRDYSFTNGMTYINGANIKTGKISADRLNVSEIVVNGGGATVTQMDDAKQQAIVASKAYADANDELLQVIAEAYADDVVSSEEQARIQDATQKLMEAKQHAENAANNALESSKNYTDGLISSLGDLAHEDLVELAKLGETIIQGGYIKAELIDVISLFAQSAFIENLIVKRLSSGVDDVLPRLLAQSGEIGFYKNRNAEANVSNALIRMGLEVGYMQSNGSNKPGLSIRDKDGDDSYSEITSEGVFSNGSNINAISATSGISSAISIAALLQSRVSGSLGAPSINAAIYGADQTSNSNVPYSEGYAGYFHGAVCLNGALISSQGGSNNDGDVIPSNRRYYQIYHDNIYLPNKPITGLTLTVRNNSTGSKTLRTQGGALIYLGDGVQNYTTYSMGRNLKLELVYDGTNWVVY